MPLPHMYEFVFEQELLLRRIGALRVPKHDAEKGSQGRAVYPGNQAYAASPDDPALPDKHDQADYFSQQTQPEYCCHGSINPPQHIAQGKRPNGLCKGVTEQPGRCLGVLDPFGPIWRNRLRHGSRLFQFDAKRGGQQRKHRRQQQVKPVPLEKGLVAERRLVKRVQAGEAECRFEEILHGTVTFIRVLRVFSPLPAVCPVPPASGFLPPRNTTAAPRANRRSSCP